jgi:hypothetical protein
MKNNLFVILTLFTGLLTFSQEENKTIIKGEVRYWPSDTIYLQTMPFHSPHSSELKHQVISKDSTFSFEFKNVEKPFVIQLFMRKQNADLNREHLLLNNLTDRYYYNQCEKFYTYGTTTFLLEPNKTLNVNLERNWAISNPSSEQAKQYKTRGIKVSKENTIEATQKTSITFLGDKTFKEECFQKAFIIDGKIDNRLDIYKSMPIEKAIISLNKLKKNFLGDLEENKNRLSSIHYNYIKAEIEFGIRKEFLRFLMLNKESEMDDFFSKEIPQEIMDVIEFDKKQVNTVTIRSEAFNQFLMLYLNFKLNTLNKKYNRNYEFGIQKIRTAIRTFPKESVYYFLANNLLQPQVNRKYLIEIIKNEEAVEELITKTITKYPDGELNDLLIEKYDL